MSTISGARLASESLNEGHVYTRAELKHLFDITDSSIDKDVFRPSGYNSVWLFVTRQSGSVASYQNRLLNENTLSWLGQPTGHTDKQVITHELLGLELLIFYREAPNQYPLGGFEYLGQFEYQEHKPTRPALFTLARSGSMPSLEDIQAREDTHSTFNPATIRDGREWVLATVVRRRGQAAFRASLLDAYAGTCPITGCRVEPLLEAAHIIPYLGFETNHVQNGLLLRTDIHTLFDLQLLAIDPVSLVVLLSPTLLDSEYTSIAGRPLALPKNSTQYPSREALRTHRIRCQF